MQSISYDDLFRYRIKRILMICSNYDAFILKEDGQIENQIYKECIDLGITNTPKFVWAGSTAEAADIVFSDRGIDLVICMYNEQDEGIFDLSTRMKKDKPDVPFVVLMHYSKTVRHILFQRENDFDFIFSWHGNADLILAIMKLFEDRRNAEHDVLEAGCQAILLAEDSVRYYSTYLPELYKLVLGQAGEFLSESLNEDQRKGRRRSRPKILLATCYQDALNYFEKYKSNLLGVISDVGMVMHREDPHDKEKLDAGIDFVRRIREYDPYMPILLQSSQGSVANLAKELGVGFLKKYSRTLFIQLSDYIKDEFGFGDLVFKDSRGMEIARAKNLKDVERIVKDIPDDVLISITSRNMFSKWFYARGLFNIASRFRQEHHNIPSEAREYIIKSIRAFHETNGRGVIADFNEDTYEPYVWFSRLGSGSLGGKARGLGFLNGLITKYKLEDKFEEIKVSLPRTVVIATDWFDEFIVENGLQYVIDSELSDDEVLSEFVASRLPEKLVENLRAFVETVNEPLAIRSSSKLEDSNWQPFAGVYSTYMIPSVENKDQMFRMLDKAIKSVYASVYYNGSRNYIQSTENLLSEEKMGVIIQTICGADHGGFYYPMMSGVARSVNFYPISGEKFTDGVVNVAFGLGKMVVEGGQTLRFNPKRPKKILQLSDPKLALRDTQKNMFALDLRPGAFKISRNEGINFAFVPVVDSLKSFDHPELVASTFDIHEGRIIPGIDREGMKIITYDSILKYNSYPLAKALDEIMQICRRELAGEVEIEFAVDLKEDNLLHLDLLQVRPVNGYQSVTDETADSVAATMHDVFIESDKALGAGFMGDIDSIVCVHPDRFDNTRTKEMALELSRLNARLKSEGKTYMLLGPGRWGSSDPFLGVPVVWSDISEARLIVEWGIPGYQVEPSQGTHFFQNITSLGVGYLTVDAYSSDSKIDVDIIRKLPLESTGQFFDVYDSKGLMAFVDRNTDRAVVGFKNNGK